MSVSTISLSLARSLVLRSSAYTKKSSLNLYKIQREIKHTIRDRTTNGKEWSAISVLLLLLLLKFSLTAANRENNETYAHVKRHFNFSWAKYCFYRSNAFVYIQFGLILLCAASQKNHFQPTAYQQ